MSEQRELRTEITAPDGELAQAATVFEFKRRRIDTAAASSQNVLTILHTLSHEPTGTSTEYMPPMIRQANPDTKSSSPFRPAPEQGLLDRLRNMRKSTGGADGSAGLRLLAKRSHAQQK